MSTRREFLRAGGMATLASWSHAKGVRLPAAAVREPEHTAQHWVTDDDRRMRRESALPWTAAGDAIAQSVVSVNTEERYQEILGFGAEFTDTACYLMSRMPTEARRNLIHELFDPAEMNMNVCRVIMGSGDSALNAYSYDDGDPDPELKRFSIERDRGWTLPILREARAVNPDIFLFGSPFSPPGWMKDNNSLLGGCMHRTYMPAYAKYFVKFLKSYEAEGVPIQAVSVQNEVDADQQGLMPACFWSQEYEADFVRLHLGPEFESSGIKARIWIIDHNYNLWGRAIAELETPGVRRYTNSVAWHGYTGEPEWMSRVQALFPDLEMHWTEGGPDYNDPEYQKCWALWGQKFTTILRNSCRSLTVLNIATDEHGKPNIGPYPCGGIMTIDSQTGDAYHSGQYYAMGHFSRFVRRGAVRIGSSAADAMLSHCAFHNPDGTLVVVLSNAGEARTCAVKVNDKALRLAVPKNSIVTLTSAM